MQKKIAFIMTLAAFILVANSGEAAESCEQKVVRLEKAVALTREVLKAQFESTNACSAVLADFAEKLDRCEAVSNLPRNNRMNDMLLQENNDTLRDIKRELEGRNFP